jgi:hypothetical protein
MPPCPEAGPSPVGPRSDDLKVTHREIDNRLDVQGAEMESAERELGHSIQSVAKASRIILPLSRGTKGGPMAQSTTNGTQTRNDASRAPGYLRDHRWLDMGLRSI